MRESARLDPANLYYGNNLAELLEAGRRYAEAAAERRRLLPLARDRPAMEFALAQDAFWATGSTAEIDAFFSQPHPQPEAAEIEQLRRSWAQGSDMSDSLDTPDAVAKGNAVDPRYWRAPARRSPSSPNRRTRGSGPPTAGGWPMCTC
jgi:hypothetical protein